MKMIKFLKGLYRYYKRRGAIIIVRSWSEYRGMVAIGDKRKGEKMAYGDFVIIPSRDAVTRNDPRYMEILEIVKQQAKDSIERLEFFGMKLDGKVDYIFKDFGSYGTEDPLMQNQTLGWKVFMEVNI